MTFKLRFVIALVTLTGNINLAAAQEAAGLWILSGQSNACGRAKLAGLKPDPLLTMFDPQVKKFKGGS